MKKFMLIVVSGMFLFAACSDDDDSAKNECTPGEVDCECLLDGGCEDGAQCEPTWVQDPDDEGANILTEICQ